MSSSLATMFASSYQKWKFNPLYNYDGSPSYFRAVLLALFALSLIAHVCLKTPSATSNSALTLDGSLTASALQEEPEAESSTWTQGVSTDSQGHATLSATASEQSKGWSFLGFSSEEAKVHQKLLANRKQALLELSDGAAFLNSCGNINSGYIGCRFSFSKKVSPYYDSTIEAADDGFMITLVAKGEQQQDGCVKFVVNSEGLYQAFNLQGVENQQCFLNTAIGEQMLSIHRVVDDVKGSPAPSGAKLASK